MTVISTSVVIRCTPEEAFDYLSGHRNELEWNPGIESIDKLTDGPVGPGTKCLAKWKSAPKAVEVETIAYDRPHGWSIHNSGPVEVTVTVRLQPTATGTRLSSDFEARPHGFFRLIFPLFLMKIRREEAAKHDSPESSSRTPSGRGPGQLAMRRLTSRPDRTSVTGPAAWFIRFTGANGIVCPLGFDGFTIFQS